jgi:6-phosphogluconolactonase
LKYPNMNFLGFLSSKNFKKSIKDYDNTLLNIKFDLAVLGVGTDGHVASIFPNESYIISETENSFYCKSKLHEYNRFSLKLDYILQSKKIILYFNGPKKIDAYKHFFNLDFYPLNEFLKKNKKLDIYLGEYI